MVGRRSEIVRFIADNDSVLVLTEKTYGSTPREAGAFMLVGKENVIGTIGGGQLEYIAIDKARRMLRNNDREMELKVALGSEIGQCCGGKVVLSLRIVDDDVGVELHDILKRQESRVPHVYIFGAGHVGRALAVALKELPFKTIMVDERERELAMVCDGIECRLSALPEAEIRDALPHSSFVILTHDHGLDFLLARQALKRQDAAYVGMIGSKTKRAVFASWMKKNEEDKNLARSLVCPIGGEKSGDKRPQVIAALVAAEILVQTATLHNGSRNETTFRESGESGGAWKGGGRDVPLLRSGGE